MGARELTPAFAGRVTQAVIRGRARGCVRAGNAPSCGSRYAEVNAFIHQAQPGAGSDRPPAASGRTASTLGLSANPEPSVECTDIRFTEPSSERSRRIRLRHVATSFDLVAILVRVNGCLRLPVA